MTEAKGIKVIPQDWARAIEQSGTTYTRLWVGLAAYRETCERATTLAWTWFRPPVFPTMVIICERTLQKFPIAILESNLDSIALNSLSFALAHEMLHTQLLGLRMKTFTYMYWISGHLY